jgi:hypothetical protein
VPQWVLPLLDHPQQLRHFLRGVLLPQRYLEHMPTLLISGYFLQELFQLKLLPELRPALRADAHQPRLPHSCPIRVRQHQRHCNCLFSSLLYLLGDNIELHLLFRASVPLYLSRKWRVLG